MRFTYSVYLLKFFNSIVHELERVYPCFSGGSFHFILECPMKRKERSGKKIIGLTVFFFARLSISNSNQNGFVPFASIAYKEFEASLSCELGRMKSKACNSW
ncbi:hypothetical protein ERJ70_12235 [Sediminibacillus dalangtanensis]|uniref:Uncharacterized protein n=1 Tax=Sediminibacillus dalangtanensis TaxID=2729421 RepID=A0ABX7VTY9_9BACI|nr:hypothetical protein [Sediminibacillus dalangtanensis]QTM99993.1 hypothetical protein ERJ70_12235 [Sediminibacillus dalangtanensis]